MKYVTCHYYVKSAAGCIMHIDVPLSRKLLYIHEAFNANFTQINIIHLTDINGLRHNDFFNVCIQYYMCI